MNPGDAGTAAFGEKCDQGDFQNISWLAETLFRSPSGTSSTLFVLPRAGPNKESIPRPARVAGGSEDGALRTVPIEKKIRQQAAWLGHLITSANLTKTGEQMLRLVYGT